MSKKKVNNEPPVIEYRDLFICRVGDKYRVKASSTDSYATHHGSFESVVDAAEFIDEGWR